ncbi:helix-turn-helix domain-containing protein [Sinosporangium siamense]
MRQLIAESGLTQGEFAVKAGLDPSKMSKSLSGVRRFTSLDLARIADLGRVTVDWLLGADPVVSSMAARVSTRSSAADSAVEEAERLAQIRADLGFLGYQQEVATLTLPSKAKRAVDQGHELARNALDHARVREMLPWRHRDLASLAEDVFGVDVRIVRLPDGFDGLAYVDHQTSLMVVGTSEVPARQRFTVAHELGHLLARDDQGLRVDADLNDATHKQHPSEIRANAFAAEFLLPQDILRQEISMGDQTLASLAGMACRWWVSPSTLAWRLLNLGLIDRRLCDSLRRLNAAQAAQRADSAHLLGEWIAAASRPRMPVPLLRAAFQAYADGKTTLRPYANLIGVDTDTLRLAIDVSGEESPLSP